MAIVKATNHVECPPKERHLRSEFFFFLLCQLFMSLDPLICGVNVLGFSVFMEDNWSNWLCDC